MPGVSVRLVLAAPYQAGLGRRFGDCHGFYYDDAHVEDIVREKDAVEIFYDNPEARPISGKTDLLEVKRWSTG